MNEKSKKSYINSCDNKQSIMDYLKENKSFEFVKLYKSAAETKEQIETNKLSQKLRKLVKSSQSDLDTSKRSRSRSKNKTKRNETVHLSSPPNEKGVPSGNDVKSIMKNKSSNIDSEENLSNVNTWSGKSKKRNKSVSFVLEDEMVLKKKKSNDFSKEQKKEKLANYKTKKEKAFLQSKENQNLNECVINFRSTENNTTNTISDDPMTEELASKTKKKMEKTMKSKPNCVESKVVTEDDVTGELSTDNKPKKSRKKKRKAKSIQDSNTDADGEPASKTRKKDLKPEAIAKEIQNLNIGDNAHTLTSLLDDMRVVDKNKNKKDKRNRNKKLSSKDKPEPQQDSNVDEKEKIKWNNRKWNKDTKGDSKDRLCTSVVVDNLPIKIMCGFKTLLSDHFAKFGTISGVGIAETYPAEDLKPTFTTTIYFQDEEAAVKALEEDNTVLEGSRIRVRRPQPATETTLVVRSYVLSDQALSSLFSSAGRIRSIRQTIKGKSSMSTAFVEFDGPEAVERALKLAVDAKIGGKKIYASKFLNKKDRKLRLEKKSTNGDDNDSSNE